MLLLVLALCWVALLVPVVVRRLRDSGTERSIEHFHAEREVLSRQDYRVAPAHRLEQSDPEPRGQHRPVTSGRPRLTVVHADDTFGSLESRSSWDQWREDYEYDEARHDGGAGTRHEANNYARAYAARPRQPLSATGREPRPIRRSMRAQRRLVFTRLVAAAVVVSLLGYVSGYSLIVDVAILSWLAVVGFVALAFYSVSRGYLRDSSLPVRLPRRQVLASVEPLYFDYRDADELEYAGQYESEFAYSDTADEWRHEPRRRSALG